MPEKKQKGFKGLISLASSVEIAPRNTNKPSPSEENDYIANDSNQSKSSISSQESKSSSSLDNNSQKWGWFALVAIIIIALIVGNQTNNERKKYNKPPSYTQKPKYVTPKAKEKLTYEKPSAGRNRRLYISQIRWCVREQYYIDTKVVDKYSKYEVNQYNNRVNDYNSRCSSFRYRRGELTQAKRQVAKDLNVLSLDTPLKKLDKDIYKYLQQ